MLCHKIRQEKFFFFHVNCLKAKKQERTTPNLNDKFSFLEIYMFEGVLSNVVIIILIFIKYYIDFRDIKLYNKFYNLSSGCAIFF